MNLLLATLIGLSFSVRTPNDDTKPLDYEIAVHSAKERGKFQYFVKRDWERELGEAYIDTQFEITQKLNPYYVGVKYIDKQSKDYKYGQARIGLSTDIINGGLAITNNEIAIDVTNLPVDSNAGNTSDSIIISDASDSDSLYPL